MIKLNHLNLVVSDVKAAIAFFETYFHFTCTQIKGDHVIAILKGEDDFSLVVMPATEGDATYPKAFHLGFMFNTTEEVNDLYNKLQADDVAVGDQPKKIRDSYGFYFHFDSVLIEVGLGPHS